jgi:S-adenosyl-L-methionine hydrolase (adenosine-forming)
MKNNIITLTTDFGTADTYIAQMKGVILSLNPTATIIDITHSISPQNIREAAYVFSTAYRYFPKGTIHVVIVDPGVGSNRKAILVQTETYYFLAPDNGVLSYVIDCGLRSMRPLYTDSNLLKKININNFKCTAGASSRTPQKIRVIQLENQKYFLHSVSSTFHGRDIFAPAAAHLSLGVPISKFGPEAEKLIKFPIPEPGIIDNRIYAHILHIDHFGNIITDISKGIWNTTIGKKKFSISCGKKKITEIKQTYAEGKPGTLIAYFGSSDNLEIAIVDGNIAQQLKISPENPIIINL